jgi:dihydropteroate synthase
MGVINLSPESFYHGSVARTPSKAVRMIERLVDQGATIIDLGAMGTGPTSVPVAESVELKRLLPVIRRAAKMGVTISVDTQRARVAEEAIAAGAEIVNDISGLKRDPSMAGVISRYGSSAVLMAAEREPGDVFTLGDIKRALQRSLEICKQNHIPLKKVVIDPGIGAWPARLRRLKHARKRGSFRAVVSYDLEIIARLGELAELGRPICVGISRKSFIGEVLGLPDPRDRLLGSLAATAIAVLNGAHVVRTHDPAETLQAVKIAEAIREARHLE